MIGLLGLSLLVTSCGDDDLFNLPDQPDQPDDENNGDDTGDTANFVGAVYAMTNGDGQIDGFVQDDNVIIAYGRNADGTLTPIGPFETGGRGGDYDGGEGLDPLISAYALTKTPDNSTLLAVNAGDNTISSFNINDDFSLALAGTPQPTGAIGPNSIAFTPVVDDQIRGYVYVTNITRPEFLDQGEPAQQGTVTGFTLMIDGTLEAIPGSTRDLNNRPSSVQFSPNGEYLVVSSINSGAAGLANANEDEIVLYGVNPNGTLSTNQMDGATSTLRGNADFRNLPSAIGFQIVGDNYVVVTEAREFQYNGAPPAFLALQDGSVSTWQIVGNEFVPISQDIASGTNNTGRTACWLDFTLDESTFFVSNAIEAGLASYSFSNGAVSLINQTAASGTGVGDAQTGAEGFAVTEGWIDMWISDDGQFLYQLYGLDGTIGIYRIVGDGLEFVGEESNNLPENNTQGIVAI